MQHALTGVPQVSNLVERLSSGYLKSLFSELILHLSALNDEVEVRSCDIEVRIELSNNLICRIVPYRELLHIQVGDCPGWEVRIRDEQGYFEALDMCISQYLKMFRPS
jgi:hypothetical protein